MSSNLLRRLTLALALLIGGAFAVPDLAEARPHADSSVSCKKKRKKRRRVRKSKRRSKRKVTAKTIRRWQKKGWSDAKIVKKARARGYKLTKREKRKLRKLRVRKSLRVALAAPAKPAKVEPSGPAPIRIDTEMDPNDIDFDSVAPPAGMDMRFADAHRAEANK